MILTTVLVIGIQIFIAERVNFSLHLVIWCLHYRHKLHVLRVCCIPVQLKHRLRTKRRENILPHLFCREVDRLGDGKGDRSAIPGICTVLVHAGLIGYLRCIMKILSVRSLFIWNTELLNIVSIRVVHGAVIRWKAMNGDGICSIFLISNLDVPLIDGYRLITFSIINMDQLLNAVRRQFICVGSCLF